MIRKLFALALPLALLGADPKGPPAEARFEDAMEKRVQERVLENGLRVLVLERHEVPVVSFVTMANVGGVDEHVGITGVAHIFEHMAFKGSHEIGVTDPVAEAAALDELDKVFQAINEEKAKGEKGSKETLASLEKKFSDLEEKARALVVNNEYSVIVEEHGGSGLNASTGADSTQYFVSFPSNRLELWFHLEADRFKQPVLREFYKEKGVVQEERRMRTESNPIGKLIEEFLGVCFKAHPYGYPVIGHMSDIETLKREEAVAFFKKYYVPNNLTLAIVGDVDAKQVFALAEKYMGPLPAGPKYEPVQTVEPPQEGEKRLEVESPAQTVVGIAYHRPAASHPDDPVYDVISELLSSGRTSRLYSKLVKEKQIALQAGAFTGFPGAKYPNLFMLFGMPTVGHTADELEKALLEEVDRLKKEPVTEAELSRVKTRARANLIRGMNSNQGIAMQLATAQTILGDWREAFRQLRKLEGVTAEDVQRVAKATFTKKNRTVGKIVKPEADGAEEAKSE